MQTRTYPTIGIMSMPVNFKYRDVARKGRPVHQKWDSFWRKHPPMDAGRWAKIFAPFDALEGFDEAVQAKEVLYSAKTELSEYEQEKLDRKIAALSGLTQTSRSARKNQVMVSVTRFCPCMDLNHPAYGTKGKYKSVHGMALGVKGDGLSIRTETGDVRIPLSDIKEIDCGLFEEEY